MRPSSGPGDVRGTSNWIRTLPGKGWFSILRLYGPLEGYMDTTWKPGDVEPP